MKKSADVFKEVIDIEGAKFTALESNIGQAKLYNWSQGKSGPKYTQNPIEQIIALTQASGSKDLIKYLCEASGGYYVENPKGIASEMDLLRGSQKVLKKFSMTMGEIADSIEGDGRICTDEAEKIESIWNRTKTHVQSFVDMCKAGRFDNNNR
jgi:hypothetical protein